MGPLEFTLEIAPRSRFDVVELRSRFPSEHHDVLAPYPHCLCWSAHTTAGFLDRSLTARLSAAHVPTYVETLRRIFPEGAGYAHDRLATHGRSRSSTPAARPSIGARASSILPAASVTTTTGDGGSRATSSRRRTRPGTRSTGWSGRGSARSSAGCATVSSGSARSRTNTAPPSSSTSSSTSCGARAGWRSRRPPCGPEGPGSPAW
jgi:hypothetical protein